MTGMSNASFWKQAENSSLHGGRYVKIILIHLISGLLIMKILGKEYCDSSHAETKPMISVMHALVPSRIDPWTSESQLVYEHAYSI